MFWFDKQNPNVDFCDCREYKDILCDGRKLEVHPDIIADFTSLPFPDNTYYLVVFDPPHLINIGDTSWMAKKYGKLPKDKWKEVLHDGFSECVRVCKENGIIIFKWNETDVPVSEIVNIIGYKPLFGHKSGKLNKTHWLCFMK